MIGTDASDRLDRTGVSPLAGKPPDPSMLTNIPRLVAAYYTERPDPSIREHRVSFGTSGHRGSSLTCPAKEGITGAKPATMSFSGTRIESRR